MLIPIYRRQLIKYLTVLTYFIQITDLIISVKRSANNTCHVQKSTSDR